MKDVMFCQSCGMPLTDVAHFGTEADDSHNLEYCVFCYAAGEFTTDCTMDEMIENCADFVEEYNRDSAEPITREQAIAQMKERFPTLKRWAQ